MGEYKCLLCGYEFAMPHRPTPCLKCGHKYVKWLNYEKMKKNNFGKVKSIEGMKNDTN